MRIRIYELVLGGRQIHIHWVPWQHKRRITNGQAHTETISGGFRYDVLKTKQNPWECNRKQTGCLGTDDRITLLSGVCRQLYHETALLPQKLNYWSFENTHVMERYILKENRMPLQQRRAVQTIYCKERLSKALEKKFGGLKTIVWKDGKKLRKQDLGKYPDTAWRNRQELVQRSRRW